MSRILFLFSVHVTISNFKMAATTLESAIENLTVSEKISQNKDEEDEEVIQEGETTAVKKKKKKKKKKKGLL